MCNKKKEIKKKEKGEQKYGCKIRKNRRKIK